MSTADLRRRLLRLEGVRAALSGVVMVACEAIGPDTVHAGGQVFERAGEESGDGLLHRVRAELAGAAGARVCILVSPLDARL